MVSTGMMEAIVVDEWKAKLWAPNLKGLKLRSDIALRAEGYHGAGIRKGSPQLAAELKDFDAKVVQKLGGRQAVIQQYTKRIKAFTDSTGNEELKRFQQTAALFETYSSRYNFAPLMLVAQGYQESRLDHNAKSHVGAIGIMQIMPATGEQMKVGDIRQLEANIHAAAKYMDQLMMKYFADANFSEYDRTLFAFAAYNCGPGNLAKARKEALKRDLDPNKWFNNVEIIIAKRIGMETTTYVRNIFKYYVAYTMIADAQKQAATARQTLAPAGK
jgi:membrane-bound lytic murein transglycosylase MltF